MTQIEKLSAWHKSQLGTAEEPKGSNHVRYNTLYYGSAVQGERYPWCMVYIWAGFTECDMASLFYGGGKTASCTTLYDWAARYDRLVTSGYQEGDIFLYSEDGTRSGIYHTGYYTGQKSGGKYRAIEGNHAERVEYVLRNENEILGAYRPNYATQATAPKVETPGEDADASHSSTQGQTASPPSSWVTVSVSIPQLCKGDICEEVRSAQILLIGRGYSCGPDGADGEFGTNTKSAVVKFQSAHGLSADGIIGVNTWGSLLTQK